MKITASTTGRAGKFAQIPLTGAKLMAEIGDLALSMIRRRTAAGKDVDGAAFAPLSPAYAERKQAELGNADANLTVSGRMLNEMARLKETEKTVTIGFTGGSTGGGGGASGGTFIQRSRAVAGADKALFHNVSGAGKSKVKRRFFGLSEAEKETIRQKVQAHLRNVARGGGQ